MKKKNIGIIIVSAIAIISGYNVCISQSNQKISKLALANVEALANGEGGTSYDCCNTSECGGAFCGKFTPAGSSTSYGVFYK